MGYKGQSRNNYDGSCSTVNMMITIVIFVWVTAVIYTFNNHHRDQSGKKIENTIAHETNSFSKNEISTKNQNLKTDLNLESNSKSYFHIVFSTDCSFFQDWQTLLVFHSAVTVGQTGTITRIASGCSEEKKVELIALYKKLFPQYHVHFTPDFKKDSKTGKSYDFYNKPYGLMHWLTNTKATDDKEEIVVLIDPDMILLRPIHLKIKNAPENIYFDDNDKNDPNIPEYVGKGHPVAQLYGLQAPWANDNHRHFNRTEVCGEGSPCLKVSVPFGERHYSVGPPYLVERSDLIRITQSWTEMVPKVYSRYPELLAEMYAYSMAAAHQNLPHVTLLNYMVSNTDADDEGWPHIDALGSDVCQPPDTNGIFYPGKVFPTVLHFCQFYRAGIFGFQKRRLQKFLFSCDYPILRELPIDLGNITYKNRDGEIIPLRPKNAKRDSFMLCTLYRSMNSLLKFYKSKMCDPKKDKINLEKLVNIVDLKY